MLSNSVTLIGNLGSDIEMRETSAGQPYTNVNIAVTRSYKDRQGDYVKDTQWFKLVAWGKVAERMNKALSKGDKIVVEGRLTSRNYETKDGQKRNSVEVNVADFTPLFRTVEKAASEVSAAEAEPAF